MGKWFNLHSEVVIRLTPNAGAKFSVGFQDKVIGAASEFTKKSGVHVLDHVSKGESGINLRVVPVADEHYRSVQNLLDHVNRIATMTSEMGKDADLLDALLARHPELESHPNLEHVLGAWRNMTQVVERVMNSNNPQLLAEKKRRELAGDVQTVADVDLPTQELPLDKAAHRDASLRGMAPGQQVVKAKKDDPKIPDAYARMDKGNIFDGKPSKK